MEGGAAEVRLVLGGGGGGGIIESGEEAVKALQHDDYDQ